MSKIKVYGIVLSPFVRNTLMTLHVLKKDYELVEINTMKGENKSPEYLKKNPMHNIPFVEDTNGFGMNESHAILMYLATKYDGTGKLYPENLETRTRVNQRLFFDCEKIWVSMGKVLGPVRMGLSKTFDPAAVAGLAEAIQWLDDFLSPTGWVAGTSHMTVADISAFGIVSTLWKTGDAIVEQGKYPNVDAWVKRVEKEIPDYEKANGAGLQGFVDIMWSKIKP